MSNKEFTARHGLIVNNNILIVGGTNVIAAIVASQANDVSLSANVNTLAAAFVSNSQSLSSNVNTLAGSFVANSQTLSDNVNTLATTFAAANANNVSLSTNVNVLVASFVSNSQSLSTNVNTLATTFAAANANTVSLSANVNTLAAAVVANDASQGANIAVLAAAFVSNSQSLSANVNTLAASYVTFTNIFSQANANAISLSTNVNTLAATFALANANNVSLSSNVNTLAANVNTLAGAAYPKTGGTISGDVSITGNLTISGNQSYINTQTLLIGDSLLTLNADLPGNITPTENAGIEVNRGSALSNSAFIWNETAEAWQFTSNTTLGSYSTVASLTDVNDAAAGANNYAAATYGTLDSLNANWSLTNSTFSSLGLTFASLSSNWQVTNTTYTQANSGVTIGTNAYAGVNSAFTVLNAAYSVANASNGYAATVGLAANNFAISTYATISNSQSLSANVNVLAATFAAANANNVSLSANVNTLAASFVSNSQSLSANVNTLAGTFSSANANNISLAANLSSAVSYRLANTSGVSFNGDLNFPTGNVGIGTSSASYTLDVVGNTSLSGYLQIPDTTVVSTHGIDPADSTNRVFAVRAYPTLSYNPNSMLNGDSVTAAQFSGVWAPTANTTNTYYGYGFFGSIASDSNITDGYATGDLRGIYGNVYHYSPSYLLRMVGIAGRTYNRSNSIVGSAYSVWARNSTTTGGGFITASYGLYIDAITGGNTNYSIYSAGGQNYFAGNIGIGVTTPAASLHVNGNANIALPNLVVGGTNVIAAIVASNANAVTLSSNVNTLAAAFVSNSQSLSANVNTLAGAFVSNSQSLSANVNILAAAVISNNATQGANIAALAANVNTIAGAITNLTLENVPTAFVKRSVTAATTANIALYGTQTIDGVAVSAGNRVLVKDQTLANQNGLYVVSATAWTRSADADVIGDIASALVAVDAGTTNGGKLYDNDIKITDTLNTTSITWYRIIDDGAIYTYAAPITAYGALNVAYLAANTNAQTLSANVNTLAATFVAANANNISLSANVNTLAATFVLANANSVSLSTNVNTLAANVNTLAGAAYNKSGGTISGDVAITGSLTVSGSQSYVNTQTLLIGDNLVVLNADLPGNITPTENAGIEVNRGSAAANAALIWVEAADAWAFTSNANAAITTYIASNTDIATLTSNTVSLSTNVNVLAAAVVSNNATQGANIAVLAACTAGKLANTSGTSYNGDIFVPAGNLSVGTNNTMPSFRMQVYDASNAGLVFRNPSNYTVLAQSGSDYYVDLNRGGTAGNLIFRNSSTLTERLRLDNDGFLGLSVIPSPWVSTARAIDIGAYTSISTTSNGVGFLGFNLYESSAGVFNYKASAVASAYMMNSGAHRWYLAPSGTAGAVATLNNALTLNTDGNLGVGTAAPVGVIDLGSGTAGRGIVWGGGGGHYASIWTPYSSSGLVLGTGMKGNTFTDAYDSSYGSSSIYRSAIRMNMSTGGIQFFANGSQTIAANTQFTPQEVMRITETGNVGIGITSPTSRLHVNAAPATAAVVGIQSAYSNTSAYLQFLNSSGSEMGYVGYGSPISGQMYVWQTQSEPMVFGTNNTVRMSIGNNGNVGIGQGASATYRLGVTSGAAGIGVTTTSSSSGLPGLALFEGAMSAVFTPSTSANTVYFGSYSSNTVSFITGNSTKMTLGADGNVGIGTATPGYKLEVNGPIYTPNVVSNIHQMRRIASASTGINWYSPTYTAWQDYMAPAGAGQGWTATVTAPTGTYVTSWARRSFVENTAGYGWTWEAGGGTSTTPTIVAELSSATGNFRITGGLYAVTKSFEIKHPTKPGMKLRYGSLEGPENGVYVRGKLDGEKVINLPDYWEGLVDLDTITVNLTAIGHSQNLYVSDIDGLKIHIDTENHTQPYCFYHVYAERKDVDKLVVEYEE